MNILKRGMVFLTFFGCCFAIALMAAAMSTKYWMEAKAVQRRTSAADTNLEIRPNSTGHIHFGLFKGKKSLNVGFGMRVHPFDVVCDDGICMYSCGRTKDLRKEQLQLIRDGHYDPQWAFDNSTPGSGEAEFMDYGLWAGTIACLCLGMLFAVVGALFAVINTATTPVEAITGVPGLYVWNTLAAVFNLVCVICWAVQFHSHLTQNVLLYDQDDGWTTEGNEVFGYSFWLVVVAIFVHVANILIIFFGTYEPKIKEQMKAPEAKSGTIMLY